MNTDRLRIQRKPFDALSVTERDAWTRLLAESVCSRWAFVSPTYAEAVNAVMGSVEVLLLWDGTALVGVMPLQRAAGWLGKWGLRETVGRQMTDYCGLLAQPGVKIDWRYLLQSAGIPCIYFTHLDESQVHHGLIGEAPRIGLRTCIHPDGGAAHWEWLRGRDKKLVGDTERRERKLVADHGVLEFQMHSANPNEDMADLVALKVAQYRRTGHAGGALLNPENVVLLARLLASKSPDCLPMLSVLRCGGELVAGHLGLRCGARLHYWFPVYDPIFSAYSPGRILMKYILRNVGDYGIDCLDRGEGDSVAKRDFATDEHLYFKGLVHASPWGQFVSVLQRLRWRFSS